MIEFEWDPNKAKSNERKHGIRFEDAIRVFDDPDAFFREDHSTDNERRWQAIGGFKSRALAGGPYGQSVVG